MKITRHNPEGRDYNHILLTTEKQELQFFKAGGGSVKTMFGVVISTEGKENAFFQFAEEDAYKLLSAVEQFIRDASGL